MPSVGYPWPSLGPSRPPQTFGGCSICLQSWESGVVCVSPCRVWPLPDATGRELLLLLQALSLEGGGQDQTWQYWWSLPGLNAKNTHAFDLKSIPQEKPTVDWFGRPQILVSRILTNPKCSKHLENSKIMVLNQITVHLHYFSSFCVFKMQPDRAVGLFFCRQKKKHKGKGK